MSALRVLAVVPAHDEAERIADTVKLLDQLPQVDRVAVVDDGSRDGTGDEARAAGAIVLSSRRRLGKGGAMEEALRRLPVAHVYLFVDADVAATAGSAGPLVDAVLDGSCDLAIGRLPPQAGGGFGVVRRLAAALIRACAGFRASAPLSGQRAIRASALLACRPLAAGFGMETAMTIDAVRAGYRVREVDVDMTHRATGRGLPGFVHRARQGIEILQAGLSRLAHRR